MKLEKNEIVTANIIALGYNGEGISKDFDKPIFIPFALIGERIEVKIVCVKKDFYFGKIEKILLKSSDRVEPLCPVYQKCGGCQIQHLLYKKQLEFKQGHIKDCFKKIANMEVEVDETVPSIQYGYRNKFALPIGVDDRNNVCIGMYANNSHRIININECLITEKWNKDLILTIKNFITKYKISAYNELNGKGLLKHLVARKVGKSISIIIVINGNDLPHKSDLVCLLKKTFDEKFSLFLNINLLKNNVILSDKFVNVYGNSPIDDFEGILTEIHPNSFYQVNNEIKNKIYKKVLSQIENSNVIDAYSGTGTISNYIAKHFKENNINSKVFSIEIIPQAVEGAKKTSQINQVDQIVTHILGDCVQEVPKIVNEINNCTIILDPPRKGCEENILKSIIESKIEKICYISCEPSTLARDIKILKDNYKIISIIPFDMFPNTKHIETLVLLTKI